MNTPHLGLTQAAVPKNAASTAHRIEELEERIRQLEALLGATLDFPMRLQLTPTEASVLRLLLVRQHVTAETVDIAVYGSRARPPETSSLNVYIYKLRKKLKNHGVTINTNWGFGYSLDQENKARLNALIGAGS